MCFGDGGLAEFAARGECLSGGAFCEELRDEEVALLEGGLLGGLAPGQRVCALWMAREGDAQGEREPGLLGGGVSLNGELGEVVEPGGGLVWGQGGGLFHDEPGAHADVANGVHQAQRLGNGGVCLW